MANSYMIMKIRDLGLTINLSRRAFICVAKTSDDKLADEGPPITQVKIKIHMSLFRRQ